MTGAGDPHPALAGVPVRDGQLLVAGQPLRLLAERVGGTPFFAYDRARVTDRVDLLRSQLPERVELTYAVKANPMPALVGHLRPLVDGFDVASAGELTVALDSGMDPRRVSFAGPGKGDDELGMAVAAGATVEVESETEAHRVVAVGARLGVRPRVAVRVNPDFAVRGSGMRLGGGSQQFGVDAETVPALLKQLTADACDLLGFHVFACSQNLDAEVVVQAQRRTVELVLRLAAEADVEIGCLNLGGGFGIPYFPGDRPLDLAAVGRGLHEVLDELVRPRAPGARVVVELGRYLVGEAGVYVCRIVDRKVSRGEVFLVVDGGMHHHLAASGNLGQVIRRNFPVAVGTRMDAAPDGDATVVGRLCTPLDVLARSVPLSAAEVGDLVVVFQSGAYGPTASPSAFLGHPPPLEVLL